MNDRKPASARNPRVRKAKGAAREVIGKLIGDDNEVKTGRREQAQASAADLNSSKQEE